MHVGEFVRKTYPITKDSSFSVEQVEINKQIFVNYRSLEVQFGDTVYRPKSNGVGLNKVLAEQIKKFLCDRSNVNHLNLISQVLNDWNYFEIYQEKEKNNMAQLGHVKLELLDSRNEHLLSDQVLALVHEGIEMNCPIGSSIDYYPIWRMEGSKKNSSCRHVIHFDLLVYILSNVFVQFRKEFMSLVTVDLQITQVRNTTLEQVKSEREIQLEMELERVKGENKDLVSQVRRMNDQLREIREQNENQTHMIRRLEEQNEDQTHRIQHLEVQNENQIHQLQEANDQLVVVRGQNENLTNLVVEIRDQSVNSLNQISNQIIEKFPDRVITTGTIEEILLIIERPNLTKEFREKKLIKPEYSVFDTISCLKKDRSKHLSTHEFNSETDSIVREYETSNSIDLDYFLRAHATKAQAEMFSNTDFRRKLIYRMNFRDELINRLDHFVESIPNARVQLIQTIETSQTEIQRQTLERLEELNVNVNELRQVQVEQANALAEHLIQHEQQANAIEEIHQIQIEQAQEFERLRTALERIAEMIGQRIQLPGRNRLLQVYAGREDRPYVNLDRRRHYLTEEEANFAINHR